MAKSRMVKVQKFRPPRPPARDILFQVKRDGDDVWLRPMRSTEVIHLEGGEEFMTGTLTTNPFKDGSEPMIDGQRRAKK